MSLGFRCYRSLLRETRSPVVALVDPVIDVVLDGNFGEGKTINRTPSLLDRISPYIKGIDSEFQDIVVSWIDQLKVKDELYIKKQDMWRVIRQCFVRRRGNFDAEIFSNSMQMLNILADVSNSTSISKSKGVRIEFTSQHMTFPHEKTEEFVFYYRLRVSNCSKDENRSVRLLGRSWKFRNASGQIEAEVEKFARGVVGMQPVLTPVKLGQGGVFEYCSGFTISTASGFISGSLLFKDLESKEEFVVPIKKTPFCAQKAYID